MKSVWKFSAAIIAVFVLIICFASCSDEESGFYITTNRYTQVAPKYQNLSPIADSEVYYLFDDYKNPSNPIILNGNYVWYYYWEGDTAVLPCLAKLDIYSNEAEILCRNPLCIHNTPDYKTRCILYDVIGKPLEIQNENYIYFARADKLVHSERQGEVKYIEEGTMYEEKIDDEYTYEIIRYELGSGEYKILWTSDKGEEISNLTLYKGNLYFITSSYVRSMGLIFQSSDDEYFEFLNMRDMKIYKYPSVFFGEMEHVKFEKYEDGFYYYYNSRNDEMYKYPEDYFTNGIPEYRNINDTFAYKSYTLNRYDVSKSIVRSMTDENSISVPFYGNPSGFSIIQDRIYIMDGRIFASYDLSITRESREIMLDCRKKDSEFFNMKIDNIQYDPYTDNIYMRAKHPNDIGYSIVKMKTGGKDRENKYIRLVDLMEGHIEDYQLTLEGVYFTSVGNEYEGSVCLAKYTELNFSNVPFETVLQASGDEQFCCPTVINSTMFVYTKKYRNTGKTDFSGTPVKAAFPVDLYRIDLKDKDKSKVQIIPTNLKYIPNTEEPK